MFYKVEMIRAHSGAGNYNSIITFYFEGDSMNEILDKARTMPGVKRDNVMAIKSIKQINKDEYLEGRKVSAYKKFQKSN